MILAAAAQPFDLVPYLPLAGVVLGGLIVGGFAVWNRRRGAVESKMPSVAEAWQRAEHSQRELDVERGVRRQAQLWLDVLRDLVRRLLAILGSRAPQLTTDEREALDGHLTPNVPKEDT